MESIDLNFVQKCMEGRETGLFGPIRAFVVNFDALVEFPNKFVYNGCTFPLESRLCAKNVDGLNRCNHNEVPTYMYHFDIFLVDESMSLVGSPPLRALVFKAGSDFTRINLDVFGEKSELDQLSLIHTQTTWMDVVEVFIRLNTRGAIVESRTLICSGFSSSPLS
ncbi:unnamed protein product [Calypogeia fissa]